MTTNEELYMSMYRIRTVEQRVAQVYPSDKIKSPIHLSIGQEAVSVGVCSALGVQDTVFGTYRGHALYLAKGGDLNAMVAELYGKETGCTKGKGGSMHLIAPEHGVMGTSAIVASTIPHAIGFAYALKLRGKRAVVAVFFGDGAVEEGAYSESLNFAVVKQLPILFVCENNGYSIHTPLNKRQPSATICARAAAYGLGTARVPDGDIFRILDSAHTMVQAIRDGSGPKFVEYCVYRWREHVGPNEDFGSGYRDRAEAQPWFDNDPLDQVGGRLGEATRASIQAEVDDEVDAAFAFAESSPLPKPDQLLTHLFEGS